MKTNKDEIFESNSTRALFYGVTDKLPALVEELEILAARGSKIAKKELKLFKAMLEKLNNSELGAML